MRVVISVVYCMILVMVIMGLVSGGELARITILPSVSLQMLWTGGIAGLLVIQVSLVWNGLTMKLRTLTALAVGLIVWVIVAVLREIVTPQDVSYVVSFSTFLLMVVVASTIRSRSMVVTSIAWAAAVQLWLSAVVIFFWSSGGYRLGAGMDNRILQMSSAFSIMIVIFSWQIRKMNGLFVIFSFIGIPVALLVILLDFARMAAFLSALGLIMGLICLKGWQRWLSGLGFLLFAILALLVIPRHERAAPVFGGDRGLEVAGIVINTAGRKGQVESAIQSISDQTWWNILTGQGLGVSSQQANASSGGNLDSPLNEYARVLVDIGVVGFVAIFGTLLYLLVVDLRRAWISSNNSIECLAAILTVFVLLASLTENMLSYSWLLIPVGLLYGLILSPSSDSRDSNGRTVSASAP